MLRNSVIGIWQAASTIKLLFHSNVQKPKDNRTGLCMKIELVLCEYFTLPLERLCANTGIP